MYKVGQKLQCTREKWLNGNGIDNFDPPKKNDIVTVQDIVMKDGHQLLSFMEQEEPIYYPAKYFTPQFSLWADELVQNLRA
ncbi:hypothetical protein ACOKFD_15775 [Flagellimonas sp. S174]|uniref:hypothetical protein n=1 Tax=Flagellimonas sp. S174 TaxID=3410790 RepID=UPI003BF5A5F2